MSELITPYRKGDLPQLPWMPQNIVDANGIHAMTCFHYDADELLKRINGYEQIQAANQQLVEENKRYHALVDDLLASGCLGREEEKAALKMLTEKKYDDEIRIKREM